MRTRKAVNQVYKGMSSKARLSAQVLVYFFLFFLFSQMYLRHVKVPRLGVKLELQL